MTKSKIQPAAVPDEEAPAAVVNGAERTIEIGGRTRRIFFNINAAIELEERLGLKGLVEVTDCLSRMEGRAIRAALWACLIHDDPDLTETEVGSWSLALNDVVPLVTAAIVRMIRGVQTAGAPTDAR